MGLAKGHTGIFYSAYNRENKQMIARKQLARANLPTDPEASTLTTSTPQGLPVIETYATSVKEGGLRTGRSLLRPCPQSLPPPLP